MRAPFLKDWWFSQTLRIDSEGETGGKLQLGWKRTQVEYSRTSMSPLHLTWQDPSLPDTNIDLRWRTILSSVNASQELGLGKWHLGAQVHVLWSKEPKLEEGRSLRDSTFAGSLTTYAERTMEQWRYRASFQSLSAFSQVQGLRNEDNDTKRFAYLRLGLDHWNTSHELQNEYWTWRAQLSWNRLRLHPSDNTRSGETLAANRLFSSDLGSVLAQTFYRRSWQAHGRAELILGTTETLWEPHNSWQLRPTLGLLIGIPRLDVRFPITKNNTTLLYTSKEPSTLDGTLMGIVGRLESGVAWETASGPVIQLKIRQWLPWITHNSITERTDNTQKNESPEHQKWKFGRDGFSLQVFLQDCF